MTCHIPGVRREEDMKLREKTLENLKIKGAFGAQELYDKHRGEYKLTLQLQNCSFMVNCL